MMGKYTNTSHVSRRNFLRGAIPCLTMPLLAKYGITSAFAATPTAQNAVPQDFMTLSHFLSGHQNLDAQLGQIIYQKLQERDSQFNSQVQQLVALIKQQNLPPEKLHAYLQANNTALVALPASILTAWYVGVAGSGKDAVCVTYRYALMNVAVADHLNPPSYAYGAYGTWAVKPV